MCLSCKKMFYESSWELKFCKIFGLTTCTLPGTSTKLITITKLISTASSAWSIVLNYPHPLLCSINCFQMSQFASDLSGLTGIGSRASKRLGWTELCVYIWESRLISLLITVFLGFLATSEAENMDNIIFYEATRHNTLAFYCGHL